MVLTGERRGRVTRDDVHRFLRTVGALPIDLDQQPWLTTIRAVLPLARHHQISAYDACYIEIALRRRLPLATLDGRLHAAATSAGITVITDKP